MPNLYWTRKAKKMVTYAYGEPIGMEVRDYGNRVELKRGDIVLNLRPDDDYLAKATEAWGTPPDA